MEGGGRFHTAVRGTMFVCNGAVTLPGPSRASATSPSLLRDDHNLRNSYSCVTVQWRRAGRRASPDRHPGWHANVVPPG